MPRLMYFYELTVRSNHKTRNFPFDMLRYDGCYPATGEDAARMTLPPSGAFEAGTEIKLHAVAGKDWEPERERWLSFGWSVVNARRGYPAN